MLGKIVKKENGITLVALAVTIVVLIILASIGIRLAISDDGIIKEAQNAKESAEIDEEQGILKRAVTISLIKSTGTNIEQSTLEKALNDEIGEGKTEVSNVGEYFEVMFTDTNRYYEVDENGKIGEVQHFVKEEYAGDITKGGRCDGSEEKPYEISCIEDLVVFSNMSNKTGIKFENGEAVEVTQYNNFTDEYIVLTQNLNFQSKYSYADSTRTDFGNINGDDTDGNMLITEMTTGTGFTEIGSGYGKFCGFFDGKENSILNIYINGGGGLFYNIGNSEIKNLTITGKIQNTWCAGGIAGEVKQNCEASIKNCINKAEIVGIEGVGGIVGFSRGGTMNIINCKNYGTIEITSMPYSYGGAGGIAGYGYGNIINCVNYANVKAESGFAGGIWGQVSGDANIKKCINLGDIQSNSTAGGIVSNIRVGFLNIVNSGNCGNVNGENGNKGGLMGDIQGASWDVDINVNINNCYNIGSVKTLNNNAGGIIGMQGTTSRTNYMCMKNVYNIGNVSGKKRGEILGGITYWVDRCETKTEMYNVYCTGTANASGSLTGGEATQVTEAEIKSNSFVDLLNSYTDDTGVYPTEWEKWKMGDEGYPVFED